jgi:hypothetical protein
LHKDIQTKLNGEKTISGEDIRLINTVKDFILYADIYELYSGFKNFGDSLIFNIPTSPNWMEIRDSYIKMLPASEIANLERLVLKINVNGSILDNSFNTNDEE